MAAAFRAAKVFTPNVPRPVTGSYLHHCGVANSAECNNKAYKRADAAMFSPPEKRKKRVGLARCGRAA